MTALRVPAPAKLNLFLKVLGKRADAYHDLQTLFHFIDACDWLEFEASDKEGIHFSCSEPSLQGDSNLVYRAAHVLQSHAMEQGKVLSQPGVHIHLEKHLPMGGGIGGGSSNAATTLLALNALWKLALTKQELAELALGLGADVPVFVFGESAIGEGLGERLSTFVVPEVYYLLVKPACHVATADVFRHQELTRDSSPTTIRAFPKGASPLDSVLSLMAFGNDCQNLVRKLYPEVDQTIALMSELAHPQLTGTGACVFAPFATYDAAVKAQHDLQGHPAIETSMVVKGLNVSPLHRYLHLQ